MTAVKSVRERLQTRTVSLNEGSASSAKATIQYGYDDIGRSSGKSCHVNGGVTMSISDAYTMQQRLRVHETSISGQVLYSENLKYDDSLAYADIVPLYGGLIAEIQQNIEDLRQYILVFQNSLLPLSIN